MKKVFTKGIENDVRRTVVTVLAGLKIVGLDQTTSETVIASEEMDQPDK